MEHLISTLISFDIVWAQRVHWEPGDYYDDIEHARIHPQAFVNRPYAFELCYVLNGALQIQRAGREYTVAANQALLWPLPPLYAIESPRRSTTATGADWMAVHFVAALCGRVHLLQHLPLPAVLHPDAGQRQMMELMMSYVADKLWDPGKGLDSLYLWEPRNFAHALLGEACARGLLGICWELLGPETLLGTEQQRVLPEWLSTALETIHHNPVTSITELADRIGYSPSQFRRLFREHIGMSPQAYTQRYRLRTAQGLLATTDLPVGVISEQLGFDNVSNFSRFFTRAYGLQPTQYRKMANRQL